jgi:hypothetical protein
MDTTNQFQVKPNQTDLYEVWVMSTQLKNRFNDL